MPKHDDQESNVAEVVNISSETIKFEIAGVRFTLGPKEKAQVHRNYALPRKMAEGRDPIPSAIELLTNHKVLLVTDKRAKAALGGR